VHEARTIGDAEVADPGIVKRTVDEAVAAGEEPRATCGCSSARRIASVVRTQSRLLVEAE